MSGKVQRLSGGFTKKNSRVCACGRRWPVADMRASAGPKVPQVIPSWPLAEAIHRAADRRGQPDPLDGHKETGQLYHVLNDLGLGPKMVSRWRTGESPYVMPDTADRALTRSEWLWWDVWNPDTTRRPYITVRRFEPRWKLVKGRRCLTRVWRGNWSYGDAGPDLVGLELVRREFEGTDDEMSVAA